jgi:hypothetical protein
MGFVATLGRGVVWTLNTNCPWKYSVDRQCMMFQSKTPASKGLSEILPEIIEWDPLCITDLFQNKSVAYF